MAAFTLQRNTARATFLRAALREFRVSLEPSGYSEDVMFQIRRMPWLSSTAAS
jgi:hypothetical protein